MKRATIEVKRLEAMERKRKKQSEHNEKLLKSKRAKTAVQEEIVLIKGRVFFLHKSHIHIDIHILGVQ